MMMPRRLLLTGLVLVALGVPLLSHAQRSAKVPRIGYLTPTSQPRREDAFRDALRRRGYEDGRSLVIEYRSAEGRFERLPVW